MTGASHAKTHGTRHAPAGMVERKMRDILGAGKAFRRTDSNIPRKATGLYREDAIQKDRIQNACRRTKEALPPSRLPP